MLNFRTIDQEWDLLNLDKDVAEEKLISVLGFLHSMGLLPLKVISPSTSVKLICWESVCYVLNFNCFACIEQEIPEIAAWLIVNFFAGFLSEIVLENIT